MMKKMFYVILVMVLACSVYGREINCGSDFNGCDRLVAYWKMNEASGNLVDSSGNGWTALATNLVYSFSGKENNAIYWNGVDAKANTSSFMPLGPNMSVSVWINPNSTTNDLPLFAQGGYLNVEEGDGGWYLRYKSNKYQCVISNNIGSYVVLTSTSNIAVGSWTNIIITVNGTSNQAKMYINGNLEDTQTAGSGLKPTNTYAPLNIGVAGSWAGDEGVWLKGALDDVTIWNRTLSVNDVGNIITTAEEPPAAPEFGTWAMIVSLVIVVGVLSFRRYR